MNIKRIFQDARTCQATLGISKAEFESLIPVFEANLKAYRYQILPNRQRKVGGGQKGGLPTIEEKLVCVLLYLKIYPTFDVFGVLIDRPRSRAHASVQFFLPVLEMTLGRKLLLPAKKATSLEEVFKRVPELKDIFLDGTERRVEKPKKLKQRNKLYSGKKKAVTRKTLVLTTEKKYILLMTQAKSGRRHDKRLADKAEIATHIPEDKTLWTDTGLQGIQHLHHNTIMPAQASKGRPLTYEQKQNNRTIAGLRVIAEHAIAGFKRFKAAADVYRNKRSNLDDLMNRICAGLWNLHIQQTT